MVIEEEIIARIFKGEHVHNLDIKYYNDRGVNITYDGYYLILYLTRPNSIWVEPTRGEIGKEELWKIGGTVYLFELTEITDHKLVYIKSLEDNAENKNREKV
jgi:hypothetical protein